MHDLVLSEPAPTFPPAGQAQDPGRGGGSTLLRHHAAQHLVEAILREVGGVTVEDATVTAHGSSLDVRLAIKTTAAALPVRLNGLAHHLRRRLRELAGIHSLTLSVEVTDLRRH